MPQLQTYGEDTISSADKLVFYKNATNVLKTTTFTNFCTAVRTAIASFFTSSTVVPSTLPASGQILVGNAGGTAFAAKTISGDATVSSTGALTVAADSVTYAKMQNVSAASRLLGRGQGAGAGDPQEIQLGTGLSMTGAVLNVSSGTGNVTQASDATAADHVFVSGAADKSRVETPVTIDPSTGDMDGVGDIDAESVEAPEIHVEVTHATDDTFHGIVIPDINAGATIAQWELVVLDNTGVWQKADADGAGLFPARGIAIQAGSVGVPMKVGVFGSARNDAWNWTVAGQLYLSATAGAVTQTAPAVSGDKVQKVGFAVSADKAFFDFASGEYTTV
jgi:hypothetical protein